MRASFALVFMFSAAMLLLNPVPAHGAKVFVRSCDELPLGKLDDAETITFVSQISCQAPKVMQVKKDLIVRSHAAIDTMNLYFNVHRGATLTIHSPGLTIARDQVTGCCWASYLQTAAQGEGVGKPVIDYIYSWPFRDEYMTFQDGF